MQFTQLSQNYQELVSIAQQYIPKDDPAHDRGHVGRVLTNCLYIAKHEWWDLDVIVAAALFHDVVNYPKNDPRASQSTNESAQFAVNILKELTWYPAQKIPNVEYCITHCSFSKNLSHDTLESKVLQDADFLESIWAISLMRTFTSGGKTNRTLMHPTVPFPIGRDTDPHHYSFDLIRHRLLKIEDRMLTRTWKDLAKQRTEFLNAFVEQVKKELIILDNTLLLSK